MRFLAFVMVLSFSVFGKVWHVDSAGTADRTMGTGWEADSAITLDTLNVAGLAAGDTVYIRKGTHTLHANFDKSTTDAAATTSIFIKGVKAGTTNEGSAIVFSDWFIDTGAAGRAIVDGSSGYTFKVGTYYKIEGLAFQGATSNVCYLEARSDVVNCRFNLNYGTSNSRYGLYTLQQAKVLRCYFESANCSGATIGATSVVDGCRFTKIRNATGGVALLTAGDNVHISNCIFDSCRIGVSTANRDMLRVVNSAFHGCTYGISGSTDFNAFIVNNIFDRCATSGFVLTAIANSNVQMNNCRYLAGFAYVDTAGLYADQYAVSGDPLFTSTSNFSLQSGSPCKNRGTGIDSSWAK